MSTVKSNLVVADYSKQLNGEHYKEWWTLWNKNIIFRLPFDVGTRKYLCGITPNLNGTYDRWLIITSRTSGFGMIDFSRNDYTNKVYGSYWSESDTLACFKFNEIADISTIEDGYGSDELGVQCELSELPAYREYIEYPGTSSERTDHQIIFSIDTTAGYIGQNYTEQYHTPYGAVELISDMLHVDYTLFGNKIYNNLGQQYNGELNIPFSIHSCYGKQLNTEDSRVYIPFELDTNYLVNIPSDIDLKDKYYVIYETQDNMGDRIMHEFVIVTADKPLELQANNYYTYGTETETEGYPQYLWVVGTPGDTSIKGYRFEINGDIQAEYRPWIGIFGENDILWNYFNKYNRLDCTAEINNTNNVVLLKYAPYSSSWELKPSYDTEDRGGMRLITNCKVVRMSNGNILLNESKQNGIDTSDATATADDIVSPKTAYVNGEKVTGDITDNRGSTKYAGPVIIKSKEYSTSLAGGTGQGIIMDCTLHNNKTVIVDDNSKMAIALYSNEIAELIGLTVDKIKAGETILGITGTYTGTTAE